MINLTNSVLSNLAIHWIGNKYDKTDSVYSSEQVNLDLDEYQILYPGSFSFLQVNREQYKFFHASDIELNELYNFSKKIFGSRKSFLKISTEIAKHLFEQTIHPNINTGDLIICLLEDIKYNDRITDAIAIIKCETKNAFFRSYSKTSTYKSEICEGVNVKKYDKACLIVNMKAEDGFRLISLEKNETSNYWQRDFLNVLPIADEYHFTNNFLKLTKQFITTTLPNEFEISKTEQVDLLNKSVNYFKENETFDIKDFQKTVFDDKEITKSFRSFGSEYSERNEIDIAERFEISDQAVKKQAKAFKSVLKLDKNFHIYIHGDKDLIEKGFDKQKNMNYYKVYFKEEQ